LLLRRGVTVQPLSTQQIDACLINADGKLAALRRALQMDSILQELATSPLMLNILVLTYQGRVIDTSSMPLSLEARRREVFANYVEYMLTRRKSQSYYTVEQTLYWLSWLARQLVQQQQAEFYVERMQPAWLSGLRAIRWYSRLLVGLLSALFGGAIGMLADVSLYEVVYRICSVLRPCLYMVRRQLLLILSSLCRLWDFAME